METEAARHDSDVTVALVERARGGDRAAFCELHREFAPVVHGIVLAHGRGLDAEDLTQDVFVSAFERIADLHEPRAFPGWLCTAARNVAVSAQRRRQRQPRAGGDELPEVESAERTPAVALEQRDAAAMVLDCIRELPEAYRETLVLRLCEGLSGPEIAARTGLTHGSVRVNLTRGMAQLRPLLNERGLP